MGRFQVFALLFVSCFLSRSGIALAQAPFTARAGQNGGEVVCRSQVVLRLRTPPGKAFQRAQVVAARLSDAVLGSVCADEVSVTAIDRKSFVIALRDARLLTITPADARSTQSTPAALAELWAQNVRSALSQPLIAVSDSSLLLAYGEHGKVAFGTTVAGTATAEVADTSVAVAQIDAEQKVGNGLRAVPPAVLKVTGQGVGKTAVQLRCGEASATITVTVKKRAGRLSAGLTAFVTSERTPPSIAARAALNTILTSAQLEAGSTLAVGLDVSQLVGNGRRAVPSVRVPVKMEGPDYLPLAVVADVALQPRSLPQTAAQALLVSNAPENVGRAVVLRENVLSPQKPLRVLYHHKNVSAVPLDLVVELVNLNEQDAEVGVIEGNGGASPDEMGVGHRAAVSFHTYREAGVGYYARVPAEHTYRLIVHRLPPQWTASGLLELFPAGSIPLLVRVRTLPAGAGDALLVPAEPDLRPENAPDWSFPQVIKTVEAEYRVGDRWTFIPFGRIPVRSSDGKRAWEGNFGVTYTVTVRIVNPSSVTTRVEFVFEPVAGAATGTFIIGDKIIESKVIKPPREYVFHTVDLAPQETRTVTFYTLPESGSNYPANLVVRSK